MDPAHELPNVEYSGFWRRAAAYVIDSVIIGFIIVILASLLEVPLQTNTSFSQSFSVSALEAQLGIIGTAISWLYFALMESSRKQATLGKMVLGIIATDERGRRLTFARATGRYFGKILSQITLTIGFMMAGWTKRKQALHDMVAKTLVIQK